MTETTTDLAQLLDRWAKVAPEECSIMGDGWWTVGEFATASTRSDHNAVILYHALTCAARRGWNPTVNHLPEDEGEPACWEAFVGAVPSVEADTPELAVLSAYVAAIEAAP